ncbi:MAG: hypothetical protein PS018_07555 [bacterium]|nr:hypothetical protein [bacterium]
MTRLILTFDDSAAGALLDLADCVIPVGRRFTSGKLPSPGELDLLLSRRSARGEGAPECWVDHLPARLEDVKRDGPALAEFCERFEAIELWVDAAPNAQLQLIWLLDHIRHHAKVASRLSLIQTDTAIGDILPNELTDWRQRAVPVGNGHFKIASAAWAAWQSATPQAWFGLLTNDTSALPGLHAAVVSLLEELPALRTGLGVTALRLLELISAGHVHPWDLFPGHEKPNTRRVLGYWEIGELLDGLTHGPAPAVTGLDERPFDPAMHHDSKRHQRYARSTLALTDLGKAILAGTDDFSRHNPVHRWWGGTELSNDRLWRWDAQNRALIASS